MTPLLPHSVLPPLSLARGPLSNTSPFQANSIISSSSSSGNGNVNGYRLHRQPSLPNNLGMANPINLKSSNGIANSNSSSSNDLLYYRGAKQQPITTNGHGRPLNNNNNKLSSSHPAFNNNNVAAAFATNHSFDNHHHHNNNNNQINNNNSKSRNRNRVGCKNVAFGMLSKDKINLLLKIMKEKNQISSIDQTITIVLSIEEILALILDELHNRDVYLSKYGIRLVGSTASMIIANQKDKDKQLSESMFNDIDLSFYIYSMTNFMTLLDVEETVIVREVYRQTGKTIGKKEVFDTFFRERVKVTNRDEADRYTGDDWSLITIGHENARHIDIKFVKRIERPYAFSIDSFHIILDPLVENYKQLLPGNNNADGFIEHTFMSGKEETASTSSVSASNSNNNSLSSSPSQSQVFSASPSPSFFYDSPSFTSSVDMNEPITTPSSSSSSLASSTSSTASSSSSTASVVSHPGSSTLVSQFSSSSLAGPSSGTSSSNSSPLSFSNASLPTIFSFSPNLLNGDQSSQDEEYPPILSLSQHLPPPLSLPSAPNSSSISNANISNSSSNQTTPSKPKRPTPIRSPKVDSDFPPLSSPSPAPSPRSNAQKPLEKNAWDQSRLLDKLNPLPTPSTGKRQKSKANNNNNQKNSNNNTSTTTTPNSTSTSTSTTSTTPTSTSSTTTPAHPSPLPSPTANKAVAAASKPLCVQVFSIFGNYHKAKLDLDNNQLVTTDPRSIRRGIFRYCSELAKGRVASDPSQFNEIFRETFFTHDKMKPLEFEKTLIKYVKKHRNEAVSFLKHLESILIQPFTPTPAPTPTPTPPASAGTSTNSTPLCSPIFTSTPNPQELESLLLAEGSVNNETTYDVYYFDYLNIIASIRSYLKHNKFHLLCEKIVLDIRDRSVSPTQFAAAPANP
ncbi:hypothetical protein SAMD00019534_001740 [Acytostelium subglobosum LB1]|uniref:hypothetical protein n=1 Tax=Acytostelium subglobosum LB1 TaxID=1410327 RepID=UPI000644ABB1|nr:hypothetical protein SAMD00019534_001740 [Acytostelium subglobosum LB1]GAM16999.1 hypothetical protein SAMD00019534_001740 [Acytostelium subglobosum LB1]|eukprot:XP_012759061.1 hypothetical protein SAMD00019534_001740 [Acytostelium subglobosum LB1]